MTVWGMTIHRLFDDKVRPYILVDVKTNSEESSCAKKLFLYEFLLSMLSYMNYICIHFDRIAVENKWKTAFCMRYELYKWMMTSFKLVNVLSTFQKYINWVLQNFLDKFCSVYVNDILIFTDESLHQHWDHIQRVLLQLWEVNLQIDIDKCEFEVKLIKYLEFILKVEKSIQMNSQKIKTIMNW